MSRTSGKRCGWAAPIATGSVAVSLLITTTPAAAASPPTYHVEIAPPLAGHDSVFPSDMNRVGVVVGNAGSAPCSGKATPVLYVRGRIVALHKPNDSLNCAAGVGRTGTIVGSSLNFPYVWSRGVPAPLQVPAPFAQGFALDAESSGVIVGLAFNDITARQAPVAWASADAPGRILTGLPGIPDGAAHTVNRRGQIGGFIGGGVGFVGVRWDDVQRAPLQIGPLPGANSSEVVDLNERGDAVGRSSYEDGTVQAMLYVDETAELMGLGFLDAPYSFAEAVNDARQVVGGAQFGSLIHGFLWQNAVLYDLNNLVSSSSEPFDYLANAVAIDRRGRIAAEAVLPGQFGPVTRIAILHPNAPPSGPDQ